MAPPQRDSFESKKSDTSQSVWNAQSSHHGVNSPTSTLSVCKRPSVVYSYAYSPKMEDETPRIPRENLFSHIKSSAGGSNIKHKNSILDKCSTVFRGSNCSNLPITHGGTVIDNGIGSIPPEGETPLQMTRQFEQLVLPPAEQ